MSPIQPLIQGLIGSGAVFHSATRSVPPALSPASRVLPRHLYVLAALSIARRRKGPVSNVD